MNKIGFNCDVCGRTVQGCTFVNGMKFCVKCYQETFGNNYSQVDIVNAQYTEHLLKENVQLKEKIERLERKNLQLEEQLDLCLNPEDFINQIRKQVCDEIREFIDNNEHSEENDAKQSSESVVYSSQLYKFLDKIEKNRTSKGDSVENDN